MVINNGFLVKNDRFSLIEEDLYQIRGWLAPRTELTAVLGGREVPVQVQKVTENVDERYGGSEAVAQFRFSDRDLQKGALKVYAKGEKGRRLSFEITAREILLKKNPVQVFVDDYTVSRGRNLFRLQGWAAAKEPVTIEVLDDEGKPLACKNETYRRMDVVDLFDEYPIDDHCGFLIEIEPLPPSRVHVLFKAGDHVLTRVYETDSFHAGRERAGRLMDKGIKYLKYNGPSALAQKTWNRLFNPAMRPVVYGDWVKKHLPSDRVLAKQRHAVFPYRPLISLVVPLYRTPEEFLIQLVDSVKNQSYENWELILSDGSGPDSPLDPILDQIEAGDDRIHAIRNGRQLQISENTNEGLKAAKGDWIAFADHDDLLVRSALFEAVSAINRKRDTELIYTDEDKIGIGEKYMQPNLKPDFDPDFLRSVNYICHLLLVSRGLLDRVGLLRKEFDGAQDYDFVLRCTEATDKIVHIPKILYHWRFFEGSTAANPESKSYAFEAGRRAVQAHYDRLGLPAEAVNGEYPGIYRTRYHWKDQPLVSVLIPNKDHADDLKQCLKGILKDRGWQNFEVIIIENNSTEAETFSYYEELKKQDARIRVVTYEGGFNYSSINNFGARFAKGDYLFLLNNDTECISEDVIGELMGFCMREDVGAVGARLYYGDDTIQHAGVIVGWGGIAGHAFVNQSRGETGYQHRIICQQDYSAETAACLMVKKSVFDRIGGFSEDLAVAFNDIDLCMKIRRAGYLIVYNPYCELHHYESKSRGLDQGNPEKVRRFQNEMAIFQKKWPEILRDGDPYYNPNLSMVTQDFSLKRN